MNLHIIIDGTWLFRVCSGGKVLSSKTEYPNSNFSLDFKKLNSSLLTHIRKNEPNCYCLGDLFISTSIFDLPSNFDNWSSDYPEFTANDIEKTKKGVYARTSFLNKALSAGYSNEAVYYPKVKPYMIKNLQRGNFQEKQVDASVVALLVRSAITCTEDYHAVVTGDLDIVPAIKVAYPQFTKNVLLVMSHPDELIAEHRQASYTLSTLEFKIQPYFLQEHIEEIIEGEIIRKCVDCGKVLVRQKPLPINQQPHCVNCSKKRQAYY